MKAARVSTCGMLAAMVAAAITLSPIPTEALARYPWRGDAARAATIADTVSPPAGFKRTGVKAGSFGDWLRGLPLKPAGAQIHLYDGRLKPGQQHHVAVIDIDTGTRDLQQCADAVMRLRAEYLLSAGRARDIAFNYTDGKRQPFKGDPNDYKGFRRYMDRIFGFAGSYSLEREMQSVPLAAMQAGDVFIKGAFPGHAVLIVDIALSDMTVSEASGEKRFLLMQSYMPAQDMHVLKNPRSADGTPWYTLPAEGEELVTPEWTFPPGTLRRFKN